MFQEVIQGIAQSFIPLEIPVLDDAGKPIQVPVLLNGKALKNDDGTPAMTGKTEPVSLYSDSTEQERNGQIFVNTTDPAHPRCMARCLVRDSIAGGYKADANNQVVMLWFDLYTKPNGDIMHFPVEKDSDNQTVGRWRQVGAGQQHDLYEHKKFRKSTPDDIIKMRARSKINAANAAKRKAATDPLQRDEHLTKMMAEAFAKVSNGPMDTTTMAVAIAKALKDDAAPQKGGRG